MNQIVAWQSVKWPDGTLYEGLTKDGKPHSHGVLTFPNNDRYEGMFEEGNMHGAGVYVWSSGMIYRGDWAHGIMHGCGSRIWKQSDGQVAAAEGKFFADEYVGDIMPCSSGDAVESAVEADMAAFQARSFQWKSQQQLLNDHAQAQPQGLHGPKAPAAHTISSSSSSTNGTGGGRSAALQGEEQQQQQKLQSLVQRLMADRLADSRRQQSVR